ncbi:thiamine pyrophosphate-dependent enzyme [Paraburkholderia sp. ZP32-5]|uniref:thiamine pyrophosphate-dependent enzyme n=1 Tax=Paraburkholderia sp. ZP32-5 TaxID=2883245 RepID=UPI001F273C5C|nr:thiamine pyrophosphate-dependent enzyme [Paraburkholderia sp. ZP32-5]
MNILEACEVIEQRRDGAILVATMGAMLAFDSLAANSARINSVPLMGGASCLGLGLAIGNPSKRVIVVDGDASLLMQLGSLASVADQAPLRFHHFVVNNGCQFAGLVNLRTLRDGKVDFCALALATGYRRAFQISTVEQLGQVLDTSLNEEGPVFYELLIEPGSARFGAHNPQTEMPDQQFQRMGREAEALGTWLRSAG